MKNKIDSIFKNFTAKISALSSEMACFLILFCNIIFCAISIFGVSNSSLALNQKSIYNLSKDLGSSVHIRYNLEEQTESKRYSLIEPINAFNSKRIKELGRNASFVLNEQKEASYEDKSFAYNQIIFSYEYNYGFTLSRFALFAGTYDDLSNEDSVYISPALFNELGIDKYTNAIGEKIRLGIYDNKEFVIKGIVSNQSGLNSGKHFEQLFSDKFIILADSHVFDLDFNNLFYESADYFFKDDTVSLKKLINKSYLKYESINSFCSYVDIEDGNKIKTKEFNFKVSNDATSVLLTIISLFACSLILFFEVTLIGYLNIKNDSRLSKSLVFLLVVLFSLVQILIPEVLMSNFFVSKISVGFLIVNIAISVFTLLVRYSFLSKDGGAKNE